MIYSYRIWKNIVTAVSDARIVFPHLIKHKYHEDPFATPETYIDFPSCLVGCKSERGAYELSRVLIEKEFQWKGTQNRVSPFHFIEWIQTTKKYRFLPK